MASDMLKVIENIINLVHISAFIKNTYWYFLASLATCALGLLKIKYQSIYM